MEEWSKRLEEQLAESAAALAAARAALEPAAWHAEKEKLLTAQQELAAVKLALEAKLAAAMAKPANPRAEADAAQMKSRLEEALAEKEQLAMALEIAKAAQRDAGAKGNTMQELEMVTVAERAVAEKLRKEAEEAAAELARQRASLADAEQQLASEKARAAAAQVNIVSQPLPYQHELPACRACRLHLEQCDRTSDLSTVDSAFANLKLSRLSVVGNLHRTHVSRPGCLGSPPD